MSNSFLYGCFQTSTGVRIKSEPSTYASVMVLELFLQYPNLRFAELSCPISHINRIAFDLELRDQS